MAEMPRELLNAPVSHGARNTLVALWTYATPGRPFCWPSADTLADLTGQHRRTVRKQLAALVSAGLIRRGYEGRRRGWQLLRLAKREIAVVDAVPQEAPCEQPAVADGPIERAPSALNTVPPRAPKLTSELTNELNARARGSGDGLGPAAPSPENKPRHAQERATDAQVVDLCSSVAAEVQDPGLRALVESKGRGAVASLPELLARVRKPPAKKVQEVACTRTSARGTG